MRRLKRIALRLVYPPSWLAALVTIPAFALVIYVLACTDRNSWLAYSSYFASAYALVLVIVRIPDVLRAFRTDFEKHPVLLGALHSPFGQRCRSDALYRARVSLYAGLGINGLYAVVKLASGLLYRSLWLGALAGYYLLLTLLRWMLAQYLLRKPAGRCMRAEWRRCRLCGAVLLVMNQALAVLVFLVVRRNSGFEYPGILVYVMAVYTFYALYHAAHSFVKFRRRGSPVLMAAKAVSLVAALVSMLSLETAMLAQFAGEGQERFRQLITGCSGGAVCIIVLAMAIAMIAAANRQLGKEGKTI